MQRKGNTANDYFQNAISLMQSTPPHYLAASCVLRFLYERIDEAERPKLARLLVQCGVALHDNTLMLYTEKLPAGESTPQVQLARFMTNSAIHEHKKIECLAEAATQPAFSLPPGRSWDECIVVCAGGEQLLKQLFCNLKSLEVLWVGKSQKPPVVVAHAAEICAAEVGRFSYAFPTMDLTFFDLAESTLVMESHLTPQSLRGFQIKLAAIVAIPAKRMLLMDADLFWLIDPCHIIDSCKTQHVVAHLFSDFWHFVRKRHEKTSSTSFLYSLYDVDFDRQEFESGVVYVDRENTYRSVAMMRHMLLNYDYYSSLTFGDKDLYYLALKTQQANMTISEVPKMLGCVHDDLFHSQSMLQSFNGHPSHIHTTLHPIGDDDFCIPTHLCNRGEDIHFVQRTLKNRTVGTVACDIQAASSLEHPNLYERVYLSAQKDLGEYINILNRC